MCGIVGYTGSKQAYPILIKGLQRLEYRGYDSAGVALMDGTIKLHKCKGKVADLQAHIGQDITIGSAGIGHTRWATHGEPNDVNAHPHVSMSGDITLIHNGIIENYDSIKKELMHRGYTFQSETDTEVLVNLIEEIKKNEKCNLAEAVRMSLNEIIGAYAIVVMSNSEPGTLVAAKKSSPLVIGIGADKDFYLASDATPIVEYTKNVVYLEDGEIAEIIPGKDLKLFTVKNKNVTPYIQELEMQLEQLEKSGYDHFMLKEIYEQPRSVQDSLRGRLRLSQGLVHLGGMADYEQAMLNANRIIFVACGTSWHAALVGEYLIEDLARIPVEVEYASEFRYRNPIITERDVVIAISQSGETADTLAALELAKSKGATILGICNVVGSTISRTTHGGSYTHAGPEIGVASTKAFTAQVAVLSLLALMLGQKKGSIERSKFNRLLHGLNEIPELKLNSALETNALVEMISAEIQG